MKKFTCIDLFAGVGGFGEGFKREGFDILLASDIWDKAILTYKENHPETKTLVEDIYNIDSKELMKEIKVVKGEVDVIIGGPPCQGYSTVGKRNEDDPRNLLFKEYIRIIREIYPKIFVMENVVGIKSMKKGSIYTNIIDGFKDIGYKIESKILNAANYGVPQNRERVIFIGTRLDIDIEFPEEEYFRERNLTNALNFKPFITLKEAISDLPIVNAGESSEDYTTSASNAYQRLMRSQMSSKEKLTLQKAGKHTKKLLDMMEYIPENSSVWEVKDIPTELKPTSGFGNTYARLNFDEPGMTITRNFSCISSSRCIHPKFNRGLTPREAARIQSFPDDYKFIGTKTDISIQIGNAVPPLLSQAIAKKIRKKLESE